MWGRYVIAGVENPVRNSRASMLEFQDSFEFGIYSHMIEDQVEF